MKRRIILTTMVIIGMIGMFFIGVRVGRQEEFDERSKVVYEYEYTTNTNYTDVFGNTGHVCYVQGKGALTFADEKMAEFFMEEYRNSDGTMKIVDAYYDDSDL